MEKQVADKIIAEYLKKLYGFAVTKTFSIDEAEELSEQIVLEVYKSLLKSENVANINGYIYRIASNVYARFVSDKSRFTAVNGIEYIPDNRDMHDELVSEETAGLLRREITYLSKIQREIIILHYFKDKKISEIAGMLDIPESTVKWHLACSRKELKMGMDKIRTTGNLGADPIKLYDMGHNGSPGELGDTSYFLAKTITQNIAYAAYHQPRNINEIAQELGINPIFVEEDVAVLEEYGFMDKQKDGRYLTNIQITIPCKEADEIRSEINPRYAKIFAEKYYAPILEKATEIPDFLKVPDNDINLMKWAMIVFLSHKLCPVSIENKYSVKRPDGGDYQANATLLNDYAKEKSGYNQYWSCGDMWRNHYDENIWWESWQMNCHYTDREGYWQENRKTDYDKLFHFINGNLPESSANAESYQRLLDKGYLLKENGEYKTNIILCESAEKWRGLFAPASEEILELSREYAKHNTKAALLNQPKHMHEQIAYYLQGSAQWLHTQVMEQLLDMCVLTEPTPEQKKGLLTIMFLGE